MATGSRRFLVAGPGPGTIRASILAAGLLLCLAGSPATAAGGPADTGRAVAWLREYLQIDTTNPPGNEAEAAAFLADKLRAAGLEPVRVESPAGRTSLVARWRAQEGVDGPALLLLHHIDVVPAGEGWSQPPFSGRLADGKIWGRGALDVKSLGIAQLEAILSLREEGVRLAKDVVFCAVADEEAGGVEGVGWLLDAHPELWRGVEGVLNEGGNNRALRGHLAYWGIEVAQKRPLWLRLTVEGRAGHASGFYPASATHRLIQALARILDLPMQFRMTPPARLYFDSLARLSDEAGQRDASDLERMLATAEPWRQLQPGMATFFVDTLQVTRLDSGAASNVVSPVARAWIDARILPDTDEEALLATLRAVAGPDVAFEVVLRAPSVAPSPLDHPVWQALDAALGQRAPLVPTFLPGTTDSRYFRERGVAAYGFSPFAIDAGDIQGIHGPDESIPVSELLRGIEILRRVLLAYGASPGVD